MVIGRPGGSRANSPREAQPSERQRDVVAESAWTTGSFWSIGSLRNRLLQEARRVEDLRLATLSDPLGVGSDVL